MSLSLKNSSESGSILIVVAAIMTVVSIALAFGLSKLKTQDRYERSIETQKKMERIYIELANYVHQNNRLPCPYFPYLAADGGNWTPGPPRFSPMTSVLSGTETLANNGNAGECADNTTGAVFGFPLRGVLPFRTLSLNEDDVKDAWGKFFIYGVSEVYSQTYFVRPAAVNSMNLGPDNNNPSGALGGKGTTPATLGQSNNIFGACRTDGTTGNINSANKWVINARDDAGVPVPVNLNPQKGLFCCPSTRSTADIAIGSGTPGALTAIDPTPHNRHVDTSPPAGIVGNVPSRTGGQGAGDFDIVFPNTATSIPNNTNILDLTAIGTYTWGNCQGHLAGPGGYAGTKPGCSGENWAFYIASAGPNGNPESTRGWPYGTPGYSASNGPQAIQVLSRNLNAAAPAATPYYDDLVLYKTNFELMNKLNSATCQTPFYSYQR